MIAFDLDQTQPRLGILGQQGPYQRRLASATGAPEQRMVGGHAIKKLAGVAPQLLALLINPDQVRQAHVEADLQRQQKATAAVALPTRRQAFIPIDDRAWRRQ
ncbi:hypothetical protein D3C81_2043070 [compost metagenome]